MSAERPDARWAAASEMFKCLSAPLRIGIIELLAQRPRNVSELVDALGVPQPLVSQHLRVLRDHCLVHGERVGRETTYTLMDDHVAHIVHDAMVHTAEHDPGTPRESHHSHKETS